MPNLAKPALAILCLAAAMPAHAQTNPPAPNTSTVTVQGTARAPIQSTTTVKHATPPTFFQNSRLPVRLNAPVLAPYDNSAMRTFGGQPETGADATLEQGSANH